MNASPSQIEEIPFLEAIVEVPVPVVAAVLTNKSTEARS